jgi:hypothetical protein
MHLVKTALFICVFMYVNLSPMALATLSLLDSDDLEQCPFKVGEFLTYNVKIAGLPAGRQVTRVMKETTLNGQRVYHLTSESQTTSVFGTIYHFRDWQESYVTTDGLYPVRHVKDLEDGKYRAHVEVDFDLGKSTARYTKNKGHKVIEIPMGIQDELSMVYFLRSKQLRVGQTYTFSVLVKDKTRRVRLTVYRREVMKTEGLGRVETLALRTSHGYLIWLTNDNRRVPVRIEAETQIGKLVGTLQKVDFVN